jgi:dihydroneopterin aldolase
MSTISFQPAGAPAAQAAPAEGIRRVFVRDLVLDCLIGVHRHERDGTQRVRINLDLSVRETPAPIDDRLANVLCYEDLIGRVRRLAAAGHVNLVETLAERVAALCLEAPDVASVAVRVEKLDVFADAASVGIEIVRSN